MIRLVSRVLGSYRHPDPTQINKAWKGTEMSVAYFKASTVPTLAVFLVPI